MKLLEPTIMAAYVWRKICNTCIHSLLPSANEYPICKSGKFREVDRERKQCLYKDAGFLSRTPDDI